ncbi:nucleoside deaminase [Halobacteriales archaeon QH_9_66_26]|nr:MAG: nucleoside deaminase [Halobacteriales archaeon QH_9_66_26]
MNIEGTILRGRALEPIEGRVVIEDGEIVAVEETAVDSANVVLPAFVNAHTHIGDSIAKEAGGDRSLDDLVAPPDGLKHRLLRAASHEELVAAMRRTIAFMRETGTGAFCEFREGDVEGVHAIAEALADSALDATVLGRGSVAAMEASDGYGASGARDDEFAREREATREAGKLFGIHAGERDPHLADRTTVALGTDNAMLDSPSLFREMEFTAKLTDLPAREVLRMATVNGAEILDLDCGAIETGRAARVLVLDGDSNNLHGARDPVRAVVRRAGVGDVERVVLPGSATTDGVANRT